MKHGYNDFYKHTARMNKLQLAAQLVFKKSQTEKAAASE
jgi:hypothetical protein